MYFFVFQMAKILKVNLSELGRLERVGWVRILVDLEKTKRGKGMQVGAVEQGWVWVGMWLKRYRAIRSQSTKNQPSDKT